MFLLPTMMNALMPTYPAMPDKHRKQVIADVAKFAVSDIRCAPAHVRSGIIVLTCIFYACCAIVLVVPNGIAKVLTLWERQPVYALRAYVRLLRSLGCLAFFEHPLVLERLNVATVRQRHHIHRERRRELFEKLPT